MRYWSGGVETLRCQLRSAGSMGCISDGGRSACVACSGRTIVDKMARKDKSVFMVAEDFVCMLGGVV
jgi:nitrogenase subunit NifH